MGLHDGRLKLAVAAPPLEGKANKAVVRVLAKMLGVPVRDVTVKSGIQSRRKLVAVNALDVSKVRSVIERALADI